MVTLLEQGSEGNERARGEYVTKSASGNVSVWLKATESGHLEEDGQLTKVPRNNGGYCDLNKSNFYRMVGIQMGFKWVLKRMKENK